jgi:hypothetical protein
MEKINNPSEVNFSHVTFVQPTCGLRHLYIECNRIDGTNYWVRNINISDKKRHHLESHLPGRVPSYAWIEKCPMYGAVYSELETLNPSTQGITQLSNFLIS